MKRLPPSRNGVRASTVHLPRGAWTTVLDALCARFQTIPRDQWIDRLARGLVFDAHGNAIDSRCAYQPGMRVHYFREVADEPAIPFAETMVYADEHLVIADKPHFLSVMPAGIHVRETLLTRLIVRLDNPNLVPLHRIDRATAGLVMFSSNAATRSAYQALFREQRIRKRYEAIAPPLPHIVFPLVRRSRIVSGPQFFRMQEAEGAANSESTIDVIEAGPTYWRYSLMPLTGRTHQLRIHMAALGAAIVGDRLYPHLQPNDPDDHTQPLRLLAQKLEFIDPLDGAPRKFESQLRLTPASDAEPTEFP